MTTKNHARGSARSVLPEIRVRRIHRRDLNRTWEFMKLTFRDVNRNTVEYQRPRSKKRFLEVYEEEGVEQLLFETDIDGKPMIIGYAEFAVELDTDTWMNARYFSQRDMRPLFVEELAVHPDFHGCGVGSFVLEQLEHLAKIRGCTHIVLEVAENNQRAFEFYRQRSFQKLDAAVFMAKRLVLADELLAPRRLKRAPRGKAAKALVGGKTEKATLLAPPADAAKKAHAVKKAPASKKKPA